MSPTLGLDLSLTGTGWVLLHGTFDDYLERRSNAALFQKGVIKPRARRKDEGDWEWNRERSLSFQAQIQRVIGMYKPQVIVVEVSQKVFARKGDEATSGRFGAGAQYRAGQGLGRAMGWLDGALNDYDAGAFKVVSSSIEVAKKAITGNGQASKDNVADHLRQVYGWDLKGWDPNEIDALALALAHLQIGAQEARDATRNLGLNALQIERRERAGRKR